MQAQLQPQPPPTSPSPPAAPSRIDRTCGRYESPTCATGLIAEWLKRPRSQGLTATQPDAAANVSTTISFETAVHPDCMNPIVQRRQFTGQAWPVVSLMLAGAMSGCVGSGEGVPELDPESGAIPRTFGDIQTMVFDPMCAAQCHRGGAAPKGLSLESNRALRMLVNVPSVEVPELMRVAPSRPEDSYLIVKLGSADRRRVGARMPRGGPPFLSSGQVRAMKQWIRDGALDTWVDTSSAVTTVGASSLESNYASDAGEGED